MAECAIPMCGGDEEGDDSSATLRPSCENGHFLHAGCASALARSTYPDMPLCPMCRSGVIGVIAASVAPDASFLLTKTQFSPIAAVLAMCIGRREYVDPRKR